MAQERVRYNSFSYNVNDGLLQSNIFDLAFDQHNFAWISFVNGLQKFDGKNFINVPVQQGLPDDKMVQFFQSKSGELYITHKKGISRYDIQQDHLINIFQTNTISKKPPLFIGEDANHLYFFEERGTITSIDSKNYKKVFEFNTGLADTSDVFYSIKFANNIVDGKAAVLFKRELFNINLNNGNISEHIPAPIDMLYYLFRMKSAEELYYFRINRNSLYSYNFLTKKDTEVLNLGKKEMTYRTNLIYWKNSPILSVNNHLYHLNNDFSRLESEMVNFQSELIGGSSAISFLRKDHFQNLYLITVFDGFKKILTNNIPIKYYSSHSKDNNYILSLLPDKKNNRILAGTSNDGLLIFDTLQQLVKHIKLLPGKKLPFSLNAIMHDQPDGYLLFSFREKNAWHLNQDLNQLTKVKVDSKLPFEKTGFGYFAKPLYADKEKAILQSQNNLYDINFISHRITEHKFTEAYVMSGIYFDSLIMTQVNDELLLINSKTFNLVKRIPFKNTGGIRSFTRDNDGHIYIGSNKGVFKINKKGELLSHINKKDGLPDECIYAMVIDKSGNLWCSTNKGIFKIEKEKLVLSLTKEDGLQENEFNTNVAALSDDGEIFFGGINGISSFFPEKVFTEPENLNIYLGALNINNKDWKGDIQNLKKLRLPHDQNNLSLNFLAMGSNNPDQYLYQYKLDGLDKQWNKNKPFETVHYLLPPGKYTFKMHASRLFIDSPNSQKEIKIIIDPPFWGTWWFRSMMAILVISILTYFIKRYNFKKYQRKLNLLEEANRIRLERERISRELHDNIGSYANVILYNSELLQDKKSHKDDVQLINVLQAASKEIIYSLRETIWALKKENFTAEECLLRIRNFVQKLQRFYPEIQFAIEGDASATKLLTADQALHIVRIVQEAITNALKHANPQKITIANFSQSEIWNIQVSDNGNGFEYLKEKKADGNGLLNMQKRADEAGFKIDIISIPQEGTKVAIQI